MFFLMFIVFYFLFFLVNCLIVLNLNLILVLEMFIKFEWIDIYINNKEKLMLYKKKKLYSCWKKGEII